MQSIELTIASPYWWFLLHGARRLWDRIPESQESNIKKFTGRVHLKAAAEFTFADVFEATKEAVEVMGWARRESMWPVYRELKSRRGEYVGVLELKNGKIVSAEATL